MNTITTGNGHDLDELAGIATEMQTCMSRMDLITVLNTLRPGEVNALQDALLTYRRDRADG